ncbi:ABC transporter permease [Sphingobacterium spiritivorum]|uniref:ABC transporter permease n=1 Tax=Sphingobacterium spiritivorum TaxID=258 RepID=UPI003DA2F90A
MKQIILNEWKMLLRFRVLAYLTLFFITGIIVVTYLGVVQNNKQQEQQREAKEHIRKQWESIDAMNTHSAVHYGSYAFKSPTALSNIDEGINTVTGNVLRLEGHVQNEIAYSEASQSLSVSKFGKLKPALLLQYVIPLFLLFLAFTSVSNEKESGRLKLLVFQGTSLPRLIFAKALSVWFYGLLLLLATVGTQAIINAKGMNTDGMARAALLLLTYTIYYYIIALLTTWLSARLKTNAASLSSMLTVWVLWTVFLPKIWGNTVDKLYPLPSRQEFKAAMQEDRSKGLDGHNPSDQRAEEFKNKVLAEYKVDKVEDLPINYDGLRMQTDEEYGNNVWDKHFGNNYAILQKQKSAYQLSGIFNPFASLQSASMGISGSDMYHHLDFLQQAENYRRDLIRTLNEKQAYGGSKTGDWGWKENNDFYKSVKDFEYSTPVIGKAGDHYRVDVLLLLLWALLTTLTVVFTAKKINLV